MAARRPALWGGLLLFAGITLLSFRVLQPYAFGGSGFFEVFRWNLERSDFSLAGLIHLRFLYPDNFLNLDPRFTSDLANLRRLQAGSDFPPKAPPITGWITRILASGTSRTRASSRWR